MPNGIRLKLNTTEYLFAASGAVIDVTAGRDVGRWHADSELEKCHNRLLFDLDGQEQKPLKANYKFNDSNQLVVTVSDDNPGLAETSAAILPGRIQVDDDHDVVYRLFDEAGTETGQSVTVYGVLRFDTPFRLVIDLEGGGQAVIRSQEDASPIEAGAAFVAENGDADLLQFKAATFNRLETADGPVTQTADAEILFRGRWDLKENGLKFVCTGGGDEAEQRVVIGIGGRYKAVAAGLEVEWDSDTGISAKLLIEGQHTFDHGTASWSIGVGLSGTTVTARASGKLKHTMKDGREFAIGGNLTATTKEGGAVQLGLELDAQYTFRNGVIKFSAIAQWGGTRVEYDLRLVGELQFKKGKLTFGINYGTDNVVSLQVNYEGDSASFLKHFGLEFKRDSKGRIAFKFDFRIEFTIVNGHVIAKPFEKLKA